MPADEKAIGPWIENRPSSGSPSPADARELWARRELVYFLALRDFKLRYTQAVLGVGWVVIQPLAGALLFYAIFGRGLRAPSDGIPYLVFVYAGLVLWSYTSQSVESASESLAGHGPLVTKIYFPRSAAPLAAVLPGLVDLGIALVVLGALIAAYGVAPGPEILTAPLWILAAMLLALALGLWLSALNAQYRDVRYGLGFFLRTWFFATPIAYSSSIISDDWRPLYAVNPMVPIVDGFRWAVLSGPEPAASSLVSLAVLGGLLITGALYFKRVERRLADVI